MIILAPKLCGLFTLDPIKQLWAHVLEHVCCWSPHLFPHTIQIYAFEQDKDPY